MFENQLHAQDDAADDVEDAAVDPGDSALVDAVDAQAAASDGSAAEAAPEVPDDASDTIARAQEHLERLNMDDERAAAKRAM